LSHFAPRRDCYEPRGPPIACPVAPTLARRCPSCLVDRRASRLPRCVAGGSAPQTRGSELGLPRVCLSRQIRAVAAADNGQRRRLSGGSVRHRRRAAATQRRPREPRGQQTLAGSKLSRTPVVVPCEASSRARATRRGIAPRRNAAKPRRTNSRLD
jgi:hypothetical protein